MPSTKIIPKLMRLGHLGIHVTWEFIYLFVKNFKT